MPCSDRTRIAVGRKKAHGALLEPHFRYHDGAGRLLELADDMGFMHTSVLAISHRCVT
jgi:hypothetical protein